MRRRGGSGRQVKKRRPGSAKSKARRAATARASATPKGQATDLARELKEAREQLTATSELLKVISSSPGKLEPVFKAILKNATRICQARFGTLNLYDGNAFRRVAIHNPTPEFAMRLGEVICPHAQGERTDRPHRHSPPRGAPLHRAADRAGQDLRRAGRHRHREHAAAERAARVVAAADCHG